MRLLANTNLPFDMPPGVLPLRRLSAPQAAEVWLCWDERLRRSVVLKALTTYGDSQGESERGAALLASLHHPVLARIYGVLDGGVLDGVNQRWLALEYVDGLALADSDTLWAPGCVAHVLSRLASAVSALLDAGVVHGDIAPGNIVITPAGETRLIDFGLAAPLGTRAEGAGTPGFAAPEVVERMDLGARTDLWSIAALGLWMLGNETPGWIEDQRGRVQLVVPAWRTADPLAGALQRLLSEALAMRPESRPDIVSFTAQLEALRSQCPSDLAQLRAFAQAAL